MKSFTISLPALALAALMSLGMSGVVQAKNLNPREQTLVQPGMTPEQVEQAIGKTMHKVRYRLSGLTTWTYGTTDFVERVGDRVYQVDFGPDGKVKAASAVRLPDFE